MANHLQSIVKIHAVLLVQRRLREADVARCDAILKNVVTRRLSMMASVGTGAPDDPTLTLKLKRLVQFDQWYDEAQRACVSARSSLARIDKQHEILLHRLRLEQIASNRQTEMNEFSDWFSSPKLLAEDGEFGGPQG